MPNLTIDEIMNKFLKMVKILYTFTFSILVCGLIHAGCLFFLNYGYSSVFYACTVVMIHFFSYVVCTIVVMAVVLLYKEFMIIKNDLE